MIHEIYPHRFDITYRNYQAGEEDIILLYYGDKFLYKGNFDSIETMGEVIYINYSFAIDDRKYFVANVTNTSWYQNNGYELYTTRQIRTLGDKLLVYIVITGLHINNWYFKNMHCGICGKPMVHDLKERMVRCDDCNNLVFPRIAPAVIVGVRSKDKLLLTKYKGRAYTRYALVAGFAEIGESIEDTVRREVMEETSLEVKNITYYKSQPWGFSGDLLLGFWCDACDESAVKVDDEELSEATWINREDVPDYNEGLSLTEEMMKKFKNKEF